jgi:hypothetical protein
MPLAFVTKVLRKEAKLRKEFVMDAKEYLEQGSALF